MEWRVQRRTGTTIWEAFVTPWVRENEQTNRKQVPGVGSSCMLQEVRGSQWCGQVGEAFRRRKRPSRQRHRLLGAQKHFNTARHHVEQASLLSHPNTLSSPRG